MVLDYDALKRRYHLGGSSLSLDIGCGNIGLGDVNIDVEVPKGRVPHNFIRMDACDLKFADETFDFVESHHCIEHVSNPYKFLSEAKRVLKVGGFLLIICPHRLSSGAKNEGHRWFFTRKWFDKNLEGCMASAVFIPHLLVQNIRVEWRKSKND